MIFNPTTYFFPKCSKREEEKHNIGTPFHMEAGAPTTLCLVKVFLLYFEMVLIVRLAQCLDTLLS